MTTVESTRVSRSPYRYLWIVLALLIPAALLGFAPSYFKGLTFSDMSFTALIHGHAALMMLWILMLIGQAWFISTKRYTVHRWVGRSSFIIAPLIIAMTMLIVHERLNRDTEIATLTARFQIYNLMQVIGFGLAWALAIVYRRRTPIHVRFMVSTVFAMGNAILFRIILNWFEWVPGLGAENIENVAAANGAVLLLMLLALIASDWRLGIKRSPFWLVTITTLIIHIGFFTFTRTVWWMSLVQRFADLGR
jgi:hypothetical protein